MVYRTLLSYNLLIINQTLMNHPIVMLINHRPNLDSGLSCSHQYWG